MSSDICMKGFKQYAPYFAFISSCDPSKLFDQLKQVFLTLGNITLRCARPTVLKLLKTKKQLLHFSLAKVELQDYTVNATLHKKLKGERL